MCFDNNPKLISQTQVFLEAHRNIVVGITGTKGKSTTSTMLYRALEACTDRNVVLLGNIGKPCLDYFDDLDENSIVVFEMSCHQLASASVSPHISVFLNLFEEHLDYYETMDRYFEAKASVATHQLATDYFYRGANVPEIASDSKQFTVTADESFDLKILGEHNQINANFVYRICCDVYGCEPEAVRESIESFTGLEHRLQKVGNKDGIDFYDDSISTIPNATIGALESVPNARTVLVGGMDRHIDYSALVKYIKERQDIIFLMMYESGKRIMGELGQENLKNAIWAEDLEGAVSMAKKLTEPGYACLLSPAAPSYGYFKNFEERGDRFKEYALS